LQRERGREVGYAGEKEEKQDLVGGEWWGERERGREGGRGRERERERA